MSLRPLLLKPMRRQRIFLLWGMASGFVSAFWLTLSAYSAPTECPTGARPPRIDIPFSGDYSFLARLIQFLFYLALALLVAFALYFLLRWLLGRQAQPNIPAPDLLNPTRATPPDLLRAAEEHASQGNYRLALRYLYTAVLVHLDRSGYLQYEPTNTDWEHLRALHAQGHESLHAQLLPLTELVQRKWYGIETTLLEDFQQARQAAQPLLVQQGAA